jgi:hypothetical protein
MRHQQQVQTIFFEPRSKTTEAASVIHREECSKNQLSVAGCQLPVTNGGSSQFRHWQLDAGNW